MKNILFVHQSAELYGSDKTLFLLVTQFKSRGINPIVLLPQTGPLLTLLQQHNIQVIISPVVKISRTMFGIKNLLSLPFQIRSSLKRIDKACEEIKIDLVYSNTLAVLIGLIYAKQRKLKHIWHIHEIIETPAVVKAIFKKLISLKTNSRLIYNSYATREFWEKGRANTEESSVVWNGISRESEQASDATVDDIKINLFGVRSTDIVICLVGRINRSKGQQLLLSAFKKIAAENNSVKLVFIGSAPPQQEIYLDNLKLKIDECQLQDCVKIVPFQNNIWNIWQSIDIAVVPSTTPESFGLVAVEAMLCRKPVIAAKHGGITEIIIHEESGLLFEPNNSVALEMCLRTLIDDRIKREVLGQKGYNRAVANFTLDNYVTNIEHICLNI